MSDRDELATILRQNRMPWVTNTDHLEMEEHQAAVILAAGYRKPRTITTVEELDALPVGSVVLDGDVCVRRDDGYWKVSDLAGVYASKAITLPATVIHEPTA